MSGTKPTFRKHLSKPGLLQEVRSCFEAISDEVRGRKYGLADYLMSGLAVFSLKFPSLLQFDRQARSVETIRSNLGSLFGVQEVPSDSGLRKRLDPLDPGVLRPAFRRVFRQLQRGKALEGYAYWEGHYLLSIDGTGTFSSSTVHCANCCEKHRRDGSTEYYHQLLAAVVVHPEHREVFPLAPEPIRKSDGANKNDCEREAAKRLIADVRREHPHLPLIVLEDGLASNGPHIKELQKHGMRFILGAKRGDHAALFEELESSPRTQEYELKDRDGVRHEFRYLEGAALNKSHPDLKINVLDYRETKPEGSRQHFTWVTDLPVNRRTVMRLMRAGRARWRVENETFNTLKNQSYELGHNFGHGHCNLSDIMANLMMLAFLIDQVEQRCCALFAAALEKAERLKYLREDIRSFFRSFRIPDWETLYLSIAYPSLGPALKFNDSS